MSAATHKPILAFTLLTVGLGGLACTPVWAQRVGEPLPLQLRSAAEATDRVRVFVELDTEPVAAYRARTLGTRGREPGRAAQIAQARRVDVQQRRLAARVAQLSERIDARLRVAANGFRVLARRDRLDALRALPGVRAVTPLALHSLDRTSSVPWVGAPALWPDTELSGVTIAVIDTGIDYTHADFGGSGRPRDFATNDPGVIEPGSFPTAHIVGGFDFAGPTYNARDPDSVPEPDADPLDVNGHGTHVAGIAAGAGVGYLGPGVAVGAALFAVKVFGDGGGSTDLVADAIEYALDPNGDGVLDDRVDVINMSLGSPFGDPNDASAIAAANAVANGVIVVASAGNRGETPYVTGSPGVAPGVISVAASFPGNRTYPALSVTGDDPVEGLHEAREGLGPVSIAQRPHSAQIVRAVSAMDDGDGNPLPEDVDDLACHPLRDPAATRGRMVLAGRGNCAFETKYLYAQEAGATALIVYNSAGDPFVMSGVGAAGRLIAIPGLMIGAASGSAILASLADGETLTATVAAELRVAADPGEDDTLAAFTSSGPGHGGSTFKPDLAAPGRRIVSGDAGSGTDSVSLSGTSMAAPHVAGAAALLRARFPSLTPAAIKALLQNGSTPANSGGPGTFTPYPLTRQGVGILRIDTAAALTSYASPGGVSFGRVEGWVAQSLSRAVDLQNLGNTERIYAVTHVIGDHQDGVQVRCPETVTVAANASVGVVIELDTDPDDLRADDGLLSQRESFGWCILDDGVDRLHVGYTVAADGASDIAASEDADLVTLFNSAAAHGIADAFTLARRSVAYPGRNPLIRAVGYRDMHFIPTLPSVEIAIALGRRWEAPADFRYDLYIDRDGDGVDETLLRLGDWSEFGGSEGSLVTAQYPLDENGEPDTEAGFIDWLFFTADFNDQVLFAPFSMNSPLAGGFLGPDDRDFRLRLVVTTRDGYSESWEGVIDVRRDIAGTEVVHRSIHAGESVPVSFSGPGQILWTFTTNVPGAQSAVSVVGP